MRTIPALFDESVRKYGTNTAFWEKTGDTYEPTTYTAMQRQARAVAASLKHLGVRKGDRVALLANARRDWVVSEMAILYTGAMNVPLSTKLETPDLVFRLNHSTAKILFVSEYQYAKLSPEVEAMPALEKVVLLDKLDKYSQKETFLQELVAKGEALLQENPRYLEGEIASIHEEDSALISYTSGTSADPKGVVLSHKNLWVNSLQCSELFPLPENLVSLLILPLDHSFAHTALLYTVIRYGASCASVQGKTPAESLRYLSANIKETRPQLIISVPALSKNFKKSVETAIKSKGAFARTLYKIGIACGTHYHGLGHNRGRGLRALSYIPYKIVDALVFSKIRGNFGGRLRYFVGGGALLDIELQKFFFSVGIPVYQGYGLTEASPVISANTGASHKLGSSGKIVNHLELRICDNDGRTLPAGQKGEIVVKGDNVMKEYYLNPTATAEALKDGWLYSGDMGYVDKDGYLYVLGRFKSLLIGSDGEKYSPEGIEGQLAEKSRFIEQVMLYNNQRTYTTAVIVPSKEAMKSWLQNHKHGVDKHGTPETAIIRQLEKEINDLKGEGTFPERWLPSSFAVIDEPFTEDNRMINSTMKMVRNKIVEAYEDRIEEMYKPEGKNTENPKNIEAIRKLLS